MAGEERRERDPSSRQEDGASGVGTTSGPEPTDLSQESVDARAASLVGRVISGRYRIVAPIAKGGMGAVFRGEHLHMRKRVAIKILHSETEDLPGLVAQFEREAIAGAHVTHPNVAIATDFGELEDGSYFLILEYVRGVMLSEVLERGPLPVERAVHIAKQIAAALQAVHDMDIVHRDVKPRNIMLVQGPDDQAKLIDFGFAKVPVERMSTEDEGDPAGARRSFKGLSGTISDPDTIFGTIGYLAPEAATGMDAVDGRSDLYALGVIMYEMLTGKRPFEAAGNAELFQLHRLEPPPPFRERAPGIAIPPAIEAVVMRLLAKGPPARFQSGAEVALALDRAVAKAPLPPPRTDDALAEMDLRLEPPPRSRKGLLAALLLALVGIAVGYVVFRERTGAVGAAASGEADARPAPKQEVDGLGAAGWTTRLLAAPAAHDWEGGAKALSALAELDPTALRDAKVAKAATAVAVDVTRAPQAMAAANELFELLSLRFGAEGLDVLYNIAESRGGSDGAKRAMALLRKSEIIERATPALKIAIELREAPCDKKRDLFERAVAEGDKRALTVLTSLWSLPCRGAQDPCCYKTSKFLGQSIADLTKRLKKK